MVHQWSIESRSVKGPFTVNQNHWGPGSEHPSRTHSLCGHVDSMFTRLHFILHRNRRNDPNSGRGFSTHGWSVHYGLWEIECDVQSLHELRSRFSDPLLTIRLDFIPEDGDKTILQEIEYLISENSPRICGYLSEVRVVEIKSQQDANLFITKRMTTRENFRFSKDTLSLLGRSEIFRWIQYIDTLPTMFNGNELLDFRWSRMGMSMKNVDLVLSDFLRDSLHNWPF